MRLQLRSFTPIFLLAGTAIAYWSVEAAGFRFNSTPSVPVGLYRLSRSAAEVGDLVAACLPEPAGALGRERGYLRQGSCPAGASPVIKYVAATSGSLVEIKTGGVFVDGQRIQGPATPVDSQGRRLIPFTTGSHILLPGQLWLFSPHENSWDSRFFGPIRSSRILGTVHPLLTVDPVQTNTQK